MDFVTIQSASNTLIKKVRSLHTRLGRKKANQFLAEGESVVIEAISKAAKISAVVVSESYLNSTEVEEKYAGLDKITVLDDKLFQSCSSTDSPKGILAVIEKQNYCLDSLISEKNPLLSLACEVTDPGNLGTMMRSSLAFGAGAILLSKGTVDPYNPKVVRSAAGAIFSLPLVQDIETTELVELAKNNKIQIVSMAGGGSTAIESIDLKKPTLLLLGNEAHGLPDSLISNSDHVANISIAPQCESLNVSIAHAIALWEAHKQRL